MTKSIIKNKVTNSFLIRYVHGVVVFGRGELDPVHQASSPQGLWKFVFIYTDNFVLKPCSRAGERETYLLTKSFLLLVIYDSLTVRERGKEGERENK